MDGEDGWGRDVQHADADGECALGLHAVSSDGLVFDNVAVLGDVPRGAVVFVLGIDGVGAGLYGDGDGPERQEGDVEGE